MAAVYTVKKGDSLWKIAKGQLSAGASDSEILNKVNTLAAINELENPDLIYVGQKIKLDNSGGGSSSSASNDAQMVTIKQFGLQADVDNVLFVTWTWSRSNTAEYEVRWDYYTSNNIWFGGVSSTVTTKDKFSTYSIPSNAKQVRVRIKPISATKKEGNKEVKYWTASWCAWKKYSVAETIATPTNLTVSLEGLKLTASVSNLKDDPSIVQFEVVKNDASTYKKEKANVSTSVATYMCDVVAGGKYKVRCRAYRDSIYSEWSDYSSNYETIPATPAGFTKCEPKTNSSIYLEWASVENATSYDIEYTTKKSNFDGSDQVTQKTGLTGTSFELTQGIESGQEYFFRIRATNKVGSSGWSEISNTIIGDLPYAPTTWSSTTTVVVGEPLNLYWVHNARDGSSQTYANLEVYVDGELTIFKDIENSTKEDEKDKTSVYVINTSEYPEGTKIKWRVQTAGISKIYGDWSVMREIDIYAPPTLEMSVTNSDGDLVDATVFYKVLYNSQTEEYTATTERVSMMNGTKVENAYTATGEQVYSYEDDDNTVYYYEKLIDTLNHLPFKIEALAGPSTQRPIGYHVSITSNEIYDTVDNVGNSKIVNVGESVYSKYFDVSEKLEVDISAGDISLENNISYTITCTVSMNSGLTTTTSSIFTVSWSSTEYVPNAEIGIDEDTLTASIRPYCASYKTLYYKVNRYSNAYTKTSEVITNVYGSTLNGVKTDTGEQVYSGVDANGNDVHYCITEATNHVTDVTLSVYRREFDGSFTELMSGIDGGSNACITDPHPALDYARYRIVAISKSTGTVSYYDPPGHPVGGKAVVLQWDEDWSTFDTLGNEDALEQPPWSGSMLKLPYNIDVSNKYSPDTSLIKYIGRKHPVGYYGTQTGETATWNVDIEADDKDTLYALRRLAVWMGNVYVREPSGSGYWANVKISFGQKHLELTIPVTIEVTRVEGGA